MTSLSAARAVSSEGLRLSSRVAAPAAVALWCIALIGASWLAWGDLRGDTGYDQLAAARTAAGDLPYADYVYFYGPAVPFLLGGVYALTGAGMGPAIVAGLVLAALAVGLTYWLGALLASPWIGALAAAIVATVAFSASNNSYVLAHTMASPLATVFALAMGIALVHWRRTASTRLLALAGAFAGLATLARVDFGVSLWLALAGWLAFSAWRATDRRRVARDAALLLGVAAAIPLLGYGAFLAEVSLDTLLFDNLWPREQMDAAVEASLRAAAPFTASSIAELGARAFAYAALCAGLAVVAAGIARGGRARLAMSLVLLAGAAVAVAVAVTQPQTIRFRMVDLYGFVPVAAAVTALALVWIHRRRGTDMSGAAELGLLGAIFLAGSSVAVYAMFTPYPDAGNAPYLWPIAALLIAWLHIAVLGRASAEARRIGIAWLAFLALAGASVVVSDARQDSVKVEGPGGTLHAAVSEGPAFQAVLDTIARETRAGEPILLAPQLSGLYLLADRTSPLPQLTLLPGALPTARDEAQAIAAMDGVRLAVTDRTPLPLYGSGPFGTAYDREIGAWLRRDFDLSATVRGHGRTPRTLDIWTRRVQ